MCGLVGSGAGVLNKKGTALGQKTTSGENASVIPVVFTPVGQKSF